MRHFQQMVQQWMEKAGQACPKRPQLPPEKVQDLRISLHREEGVNELIEAFAEQDLVKVADSIADTLVVVLGTACACGIDIQPIFEEVMRSNFSKFIDGYARDDGKWIKGPSYTPANLEPLIKQQQNL